MVPSPIAVTLKVTAILEELHVPYFIGGSVASTLYGMVRTTQDSDLIADLRSEHIRPLALALEGEFFIDPELVTDAVARRASFNIIHRESMFKVDVFIPRETAFIKNQFARARREILSADPEARAYVATAEDVLLAKLDWYRLGGESSERQWRDVLGVLKLQADTLDRDYLRRMAEELKVGVLLDLALSEARPRE
ncbi:MAG: hypothetical protein WBM17_06850 [Anaerolineales bacterium]